MIENPIPWPNGARCAVCISWDVDADSGLNYYNPERADTLVASQTLTRYDPVIAVPRIVEMCRRFEMKQTFFVPGWCMEKYPETIDRLVENGHEIALHGYLHERPNEQSAEDERYWLERCVAVYERRFGERAVGWRAPSFAFSKHSLEYLLDVGIEYDSSLMGDDIPYLLRAAKSGRTLVELPTQWVLDDWPHYMHGRDFNYQMPISAPARVLEIYRSEFDAAWQHGGLWVSVWHPFVSGRLARIAAVIELIEHMQAKGGVWFARLDEVYRHVQRLVADRRWQPRTDVLPHYESPIPELAKR